MRCGGLRWGLWNLDSGVFGSFRTWVYWPLDTGYLGYVRE